MTTTLSTIGTGNIAGVATAIFLGGPGAVFWMWMTALSVWAPNMPRPSARCGSVKRMRTAILSAVRCKDGRAAIVSPFSIGNMVQANLIADALHTNFSIPHLYTGIIVSLLVGSVLLGGIQRAMVVLVINANAILWAAIRFGVARGVFSNEAGLGSAPIAHAGPPPCPYQSVSPSMLYLYRHNHRLFLYRTGNSVDRCLPLLSAEQSMHVSVTRGWLVADTLNAMMAIPNLIALVMWRCAMPMVRSLSALARLNGWYFRDLR